MRRSVIGKRRRESPSPFANVEVHLVDPRLESKHHAVTNVDPIGVIEHFTFADVAHEVGRWAHLLRLNGLEPGDRVLVLAGREWGWRCSLFGVLRAGGVAVPCPASLPLDEIREIAASAGARHLISIPARPDLADAEGLTVLDADGADGIDATRALREPAHESLPDDVALVLYARAADGLRGAMHTHASLITQADAGSHWLGVGEDEPVWSTAANGSPESIWLLLAGWHEGANIVNVDLELDPEAMLELLGRLGTAAVWFSDEEYARLESAAPAAWINGSINRALLSDERSSGATAFANAVGANVAAVFGLAELGVVAGWPAGAEGEDTAETARPVPGIELAVVGEQGTRLPAGMVGDVVVRGEAPSLFAGYAGDGVPQTDGWFRFGWRGAMATDGALRPASRSPAELEPFDVGAAAEEQRRREEEEARKLVAAAVAAAAAEAESARREAAAAEERRRAEERREAERRRAEQEAKHRGEQEAREREQAEAAARAEREAEERRRAEEERRRAEERRRQEEEARRRAEHEARERERAEAAAVAAREAAVAAERRRAEEEARRRAEQEAREDAQAAARAEREAAEAQDRLLADEAERARPEAAAGDVQNREQNDAERRAERGATAGARANRKGARTNDQRRANEVRPRIGRPRVWAWQLLSLILLLVIGALVGAYFLTRPSHEAAASGDVSGHVRAPAKQADRGPVVRRHPSGTAKNVPGRPTKTTTSPRRVHVPNTVGLSKAMASRKLQAAGFSVYVKYVASQAKDGPVSQANIDAGKVVGQNPTGEIPVKSARKVLLVISLSPSGARLARGAPRTKSR